jgi:diguanylate cyclase (GGDEF)-like protein
MATTLRTAEPSADPVRNRGAGEAQAPTLAKTATTASNAFVMGWRDFHTELQRAAAAAVQTGAPLSLLMMELVIPEEIRERGGSLRSVRSVGTLAGLIKAAVGERGCLARYTEQQLAIIMIETGLSDALAGAERIGRSLSSRRYGRAGDAHLEVSLAIGIAQFRDDEPLGHLIQRASDALGRARSAGGPAVVIDRGLNGRPARASCGCRPAPAAMPSAIAARNTGSVA